MYLAVMNYKCFFIVRSLISFSRKEKKTFPEDISLLQYISGVKILKTFNTFLSNITTE